MDEPFAYVPAASLADEIGRLVFAMESPGQKAGVRAMAVRARKMEAALAAIDAQAAAIEALVNSMSDVHDDLPTIAAAALAIRAACRAGEGE